MRRIWLIVVLLGTFGCQRVENVIERREPPPVRAVQVRSGRLPQVLTFTGTLQARKRAAVNSTVAGIVERVAVRDGDTVRAGQPVIWLQSAELAAQLREQEAAVQVARTRVSQLEAQVALSASQVRGSVEQAQATYKQAQISVVAARTQLQQAQSDVRRYTTLYQQKAIPHSQLEQA